MNIENHIIELQTRLAFQEDTLAQLNKVIAIQDADVIQLKQQVRVLTQRINDLQHQGVDESLDTDQDRPPHY